ncbi:MAG: Rrf2 family transcriptional regulator [Gemmatimonadota bacterium]|nr:Rrf2 family transcriptional regulator [Gemmatimonadota bacterium]
MIKLSEASSLALHTMVYLSANPGKQVSASQIAGELKVSEAHLAKVLQRLCRSGLASSVRGPRGGFAVANGYRETSLLEIYESIEGPLTEKRCRLTSPVCNDGKCIFGSLIGDLSKQFRDYLSKTKLTDLAGRIGGNDARCEKDNSDR